MDTQNHSLSSLFDQLGLGSTDQDIASFINKNAPLTSIVELHEAKFWNSSQSSFLLQAKDDDADWSEIVDQLDVMLRSSTL